MANLHKRSTVEKSELNCGNNIWIKSLINQYSINVVDDYVSKYEISSHSENFYNFNKITKFGLNSAIVLFYILILVL